MIALLLTILIVVLIWVAIRTLLAAQPRNILLIIDLLFLVVIIVFIARFAGVL
jgi:hypothetical protein